MDSSLQGENNSMYKGKKRTPDIHYISTMCLIYSCVITCLCNLTFSDTLTEVWVSVLGACLGAILPRPKPPKSNTRLD